MSLTIKYNTITTKYDLIQRLEGTNIEIEVDTGATTIQANQLYWQHYNYYKASGDKWEAWLKAEAVLRLTGIKSLPAPANPFLGVEDKGNNDEE